MSASSPSKLLEANGWVGAQPMAFMCIPVRSAVFLGGLGCALHGLFLLHHPEDRRIFVGGYSDWSMAMIDLLELSAMLWGLLGALGAFYMKEGFLRSFYYYEAARILAWFAMYVLDVPLLLNCELGRDDPNAFMARYGGQAVLKIAAEGTCDEERSAFYVLSLLSLAFFCQFFFATQLLGCSHKWSEWLGTKPGVSIRRLLLDFADDPRYLLMSKEGPTGVFQQQLGSVPTVATPLVTSDASRSGSATSGSRQMPLESLA